MTNIGRAKMLDFNCEITYIKFYTKDFKGGHRLIKPCKCCLTNRMWLLKLFVVILRLMWQTTCILS